MDYSMCQLELIKLICWCWDLH